MPRFVIDCDEDDHRTVMAWLKANGTSLPVSFLPFLVSVARGESERPWPRGLPQNISDKEIALIRDLLAVWRTKDPKAQEMITAFFALPSLKKVKI
jgi:hypothetical protein